MQIQTICFMKLNSMSQQNLRLTACVNDNHMVECGLKERGNVIVDKIVNFPFDLKRKKILLAD